MVGGRFYAELTHTYLRLARVHSYALSFSTHHPAIIGSNRQESDRILFERFCRKFDAVSTMLTQATPTPICEGIVCMG